MRLVRALGYVVYDLVVGDDWKIAFYVLAVVALAAALLALGVGDLATLLLCTCALVACFIGCVRFDVRRRR